MTDTLQSGWVLYHGTTTRRLTQILRDNVLKISPTGDPKIALTIAPSVAEYFALNALNALPGDRHDRRDHENRPVIMRLDGEVLVRQGYQLRAYADTFWGPGRCNWENEIACWEDIRPLHEVVIGIDPVPLDRLEICGKNCWKLFCPPRPWISDRSKARSKRAFADMCDMVLFQQGGKPVSSV